MEIRFTLSNACADMLRRCAARIALCTGSEQDVHELARALVLEVLADDAAAHGELEQCELKH